MKPVLIEDHDEALKVWQKAGVRGRDLVHVDAHADFGFFAVESVCESLKRAGDLLELKESLERAVAYRRVGGELSRQTDLGNFIYPAMRDGIVRDLVWVVPGDRMEWLKSKRSLKPLIRSVFGGRDPKRLEVRESLRGLHFEVMGHRVTVTVLEYMRPVKRGALLDIDADFAVIESVRCASNTDRIGRRKPWITPEALAAVLMKKVPAPACVTVAYSTNGGWTPMTWRRVADEVAAPWSGRSAGSGLPRALEAARSFDDFLRTDRRASYWEAVRRIPAYRGRDNNLGPLYLAKGEFGKARREFCRVLRADPGHAPSWEGLGAIALTRGNFKEARQYFKRAFASAAGDPLFAAVRHSARLGWARVELEHGQLNVAERMFREALLREPFESAAHEGLGVIAEKRGDPEAAASHYKEAVRRGHPSLKPLLRLSKLCYKLSLNGDIIEFIERRCRELKRRASGKLRSGLKVLQSRCERARLKQGRSRG